MNQDSSKNIQASYLYCTYIYIYPCLDINEVTDVHDPVRKVINKCHKKVMNLITENHQNKYHIDVVVTQARNILNDNIESVKRIFQKKIDIMRDKLDRLKSRKDDLTDEFYAWQKPQKDSIKFQNSVKNNDNDEVDSKILKKLSIKSKNQGKDQKFNDFKKELNEVVVELDKLDAHLVSLNEELNQYLNEVDSMNDEVIELILKNVHFDENTAEEYADKASDTDTNIDNEVDVTSASNQTSLNDDLVNANNISMSKLSSSGIPSVPYIPPSIDKLNKNSTDDTSAVLKQQIIPILSKHIDQYNRAKQLCEHSLLISKNSFNMQDILTLLRYSCDNKTSSNLENYILTAATSHFDSNERSLLRNALTYLKRNQYSTAKIFCLESLRNDITYIEAMYKLIVSNLKVCSFYLINSMNFHHILFIIVF